MNTAGNSLFLSDRAFTVPELTVAFFVIWHVVFTVLFFYTRFHDLNKMMERNTEIKASFLSLTEFRHREHWITR